MTGILDTVNQYFGQAYQAILTMLFGPKNYVFFIVVGVVAIAGILLARRGFTKESKVVEQSEGVQTAEEYLKGHEQPQPEEKEEPETKTTPPSTDPELTRRLDAIEESLMRLSAKGDRTAIEPLLRLSEKKIPVEISGTIDGDFEIPISSLRNVKISVRQVKEDKEAIQSRQTVPETPPAEGD